MTEKDKVIQYLIKTTGKSEEEIRKEYNIPKEDLDKMITPLEELKLEERYDPNSDTSKVPITVTLDLSPVNLQAAKEEVGDQLLDVIKLTQAPKGYKWDSELNTYIPDLEIGINGSNGTVSVNNNSLKTSNEYKYTLKFGEGDKSSQLSTLSKLGKVDRNRDGSYTLTTKQKLDANLLKTKLNSYIQELNDTIKILNKQNLLYRNYIEYTKLRSKASTDLVLLQNEAQETGLTEFLQRDFNNYKLTHPKATLVDFYNYKVHEHQQAQETKDLALKAGTGILAASALPVVASLSPEFGSFILKQIPGMAISSFANSTLDNIAGNHIIVKNGLKILVDKNNVPVDKSSQWANKWFTRGIADALSFSAGGSGITALESIGTKGIGKAVALEALSTALGQSIFSTTEHYGKNWNPYLKNLVALTGAGLTGRLSGNIPYGRLSFATENHYIPEMIGNSLNALALTGAEKANDKLNTIDPELARTISPLLFLLANYSGSKLLHIYVNDSNSGLKKDVGLEGFYNRLRTYGMAITGGNPKIGFKEALNSIKTSTDVNGNKVSRLGLLNYLVTGNKNRLIGFTGYNGTLKLDRNLYSNEKFSDTVTEDNYKLPTITEINNGVFKLPETYTGKYKDPIHINGGWIQGTRKMFGTNNPEITQYAEEFTPWGETPIITATKDGLSKKGTGNYKYSIEDMVNHGTLVNISSNTHKNISAENYDFSHKGTKLLFNTVGINELHYRMPDGKIYTLDLDNMKHRMSKKGNSDISSGGIEGRYVLESDNKSTNELFDKFKNNVKRFFGKTVTDELTSSIILGRPHKIDHSEVERDLNQTLEQIKLLETSNLQEEVLASYNLQELSDNYKNNQEKINNLEDHILELILNIDNPSDWKTISEENWYDVQNRIRRKARLNKSTKLDTSETLDKVLKIISNFSEKNKEYKIAKAYDAYLKGSISAKRNLLDNNSKIGDSYLIKVINSDGSLNEEATLEKAKLIHEKYKDEYSSSISANSTKTNKLDLSSISLDNASDKELDYYADHIVQMIISSKASRNPKLKDSNDEWSRMMYFIQHPEDHLAGKNTVLRLTVEGIKGVKTRKKFRKLLYDKMLEELINKPAKQKEANSISERAKVIKFTTKSNKLSVEGEKLISRIKSLYPDGKIPRNVWDQYPKTLKQELLIRHMLVAKNGGTLRKELISSGSLTKFLEEEGIL